MPNLNQKGPMGLGSMTGRKMGRCANSGANVKSQTTEANMNTNESLLDNTMGRGFGFGRCRNGRGMGMGRQNRFRGGQ